ncbi:MAG: TetR/AcrR family transcriptional regulator [Bacteroidota bacterium]
MPNQHNQQAGRQEAILKAAQRLFAQYGHAKVTMEEIAADVGMGKASIYYYFPAKEDLFRAVVEHEQRQFLALMEPILQKETSSAQKLNEYLVRRMEYFRDFVNLSSLSTNMLFQPDPVFTELFRVLNRHDHRMLETILDEGVQRGEFLPFDVKGTSELFIHLLQGLRLRLLKRYGSRSQEESYTELQIDLERLTALFVRALRNNHQDGSDTNESTARHSTERGTGD